MPDRPGALWCMCSAWLQLQRLSAVTGPRPLAGRQQATAQTDVLLFPEQCYFSSEIVDLGLVLLWKAYASLMLEILFSRCD